MTEDDELREASDPTSPGDQLERWLQCLVQEWHVDESERTPPALWQRLVDALLTNPSLPLDRLGMSLLNSPEYPVNRMAWHNPAVPLLLQSEPLPEYQDAALRLLQHLDSDGSDSDGLPASTLAEAVARLACHRVCASDVRDFARHLAVLFGVSWPEEER